MILINANRNKKRILFIGVQNGNVQKHELTAVPPLTGKVISINIYIYMLFQGHIPIFAMLGGGANIFLNGSPTP